MGMRTADDTIAGSHQRHAIFSKLFAASELSLREDVKPERQTDFALVPGNKPPGLWYRLLAGRDFRLDQR